MHYFSKKGVLEFREMKLSKPIIDPKCVVRGSRLTQYHTEVRYQTMEIPAFKDGE